MTNPLKLKAFFYIVFGNKRTFFFSSLLKNPKLTIKILKNLFFFPFSKIFFSENGVIYYGFSTPKEALSYVKDLNNPLFLGFSYCQKPKNCPKERFSQHCQHQDESKTCKDCFWGNCLKNPLPNTTSFFIPTADFLGEILINFFNQHPKANKTPAFIITSCPLAISLFEPFAKILGLKGIAIPLIGPVCQNFPTFIAAEKGKKQHQTHLSEEHKTLLLHFLSLRKIS